MDFSELSKSMEELIKNLKKLESGEISTSALGDEAEVEKVIDSLSKLQVHISIINLLFAALVLVGDENN